MKNPVWAACIVFILLVFLIPTVAISDEPVKQTPVRKEEIQIPMPPGKPKYQTMRRYTFADGTKISHIPGGSVVFEKKGSEKTTTYSPSGPICRAKPGHVEYEQPIAGKKNKDGSSEYVYADGSTVKFTADGGASVTARNKDGSAQSFDCPGYTKEQLDAKKEAEDKARAEEEAKKAAQTPPVDTEVYRVPDWIAEEMDKIGKEPSKEKPESEPGEKPESHGQPGETCPPEEGKGG